MNTEHQVIATGFYDGPTEGFLLDSGSEQAEFFKVIAWDSNQDERLFAVVQIDRELLTRLEELLRAAGQSPNNEVWTPNWRFRDDDDTNEANQIISQCEEYLKLACALFFGNDVRSSAKRIQVNADIRCELAHALAQDEPGSIVVWRARLSV